MPRTVFQARLLSPTVGNTSYTVPAGKMAICNAFWIPLNESTGTSTPESFQPAISLNGAQVAALANYQIDRFGPLAFNAGDVLRCTGSQTGGGKIGLMGFLYDQSDNKTPLNLLMDQSASYTVPTGKHIVGNIFPETDRSHVIINGSVYSAFGFPPGYISGSRKGPVIATSGQTVSFVDPTAAARGIPNAKTWFTGFLYNF